MTERTASLLLCAWVLTAPLLCLLAAHYVERWLWRRQTDAMLSRGMREAVLRGLVGWDDVN